jgi:hypothetical protein
MKLVSLCIFTRRLTMKANGKGEAYWAEQVSAWRQSGLSQVQYSARYGVGLASLRYWKARLAKKAHALSLVPVQVAHTVPVGAGCVLRTANGWQLEFAEGTHARYLAELLGALR